MFTIYRLDSKVEGKPALWRKGMQKYFSNTSPVYATSCFGKWLTFGNTRFVRASINRVLVFLAAEHQRLIMIMWSEFFVCHVFLDQCVLPSMTYGCQTWSLSKAMGQKLRIAQRAMERKMLNLKIKR